MLKHETIKVDNGKVEIHSMLLIGDRSNDLDLKKIHSFENNNSNSNKFSKRKK